MARAYPAFIVILSLFSVGCEDANVGMALQAGADAIRAVLDDEDVRRLAVGVAPQSDRKHKVAPPANRYAKRLGRLTRGHRTTEGHEFDF